MRRIVVMVVLTVLLAGCSSAGGTATPVPATTQAAATGAIEGRFDVGGHNLHLRCQGKGSPGSPTVVYLHGLGGDGSDLTSIGPPLTSRVRVCTYDRLNVGRSDSDPGRHTGADSVREVNAYPDQVTGMVSLDGSLPTDDEVDRLIPAAERAQAMAEQEANQERVEFYRAVDQAKALVASVPDVPVTYMAVRPVELPPSWPVQRMRAFIAAKQVQFTKAVPKGRLVEVQSSHDIDLEKPELVIQEINRILEA
jgi:hypothetical protein